jgi:uncharacterized protein
MQLTGRHIVNSHTEKVWNLLMDADILARIIPGVSRLEKTGENTYNSILVIKIGPVSGSFSGVLQLEDIVAEKGFILKVQQNSKIGNAAAAMNISLQPVNNNQTEVAFDGNVKLSGLLATMGQRIVGGVANKLTRQFFDNLDAELAKAQTINET